MSSSATFPGSLGARATVVDSVFTHNDGRGIGVDPPVGATTSIVVERSVISNNGQDGFKANAVVGSQAVATLSRNAINDNGGNGIWIQGNTTGTAHENVMHRNSGYGILGDGSVKIFLAANSAVGNLAGQVFCNSAAGSQFSLGNNLVSAVVVVTWSFTGSGY
ncbi:MAG: right-handed parallel beta-helix repeat-containing protein [Casimicrobiaceae bacterium]